VTNRSALGLRWHEKRWRPFLAFDYLVLNNDIEAAVDELRSIIIAERSRVVKAND